MALERREAEIPLNGGMDTTAGAEYQSVSTLRVVQDLHWNADGELEKRQGPVSTASQAVANPGSIGVYAGLEAAGLVESRGEVYAVTDHYGAMNTSGRFVGGGGVDISLGQFPLSYEFTPKLARVSRMQIDRCSGNDGDQGFQSFASCVYNSTTLVTAAVVYINASAGCMLRLQALNIETGAVTAQLQSTSDVAASTTWAVDACENSDATTPGAVITFASGSGAPYTIKKFRYRAATNDFVDDGAIVTDARHVTHRIKQSPTAAGRFLIAWEGAGPVLMAKDATCTAFTVITTHTGTHGASGGFDFVISGTKICVVSFSVAGTAYAERFGSPAAYISNAYAGTETPYSITAARETASGNADRAVIFVSIGDNPGSPNPLYVSTKPWLVNFTASPCVSISTSGQRLPNTWVLGKAVTHDDRAYALIAPAFLSAETPTPSWCRYDQLISGGGGVIRPVARVCHDVMAWPDGNAGFYANLWSSQVVGDSIYSTIICDLSPDAMPSPATRVGQTVALSRVDLSSTPCPYAQKDGVSVVASGVPFEIDGDVPTITQPYCRPVVVLDTATAGSSTAATGFSVVAIYRWIDAAGRLHRSAPSASVNTGAFTTQRLDVYVSEMPFAPFTNTDGRLYSVEIYITTDGGTVYYLANLAGGTQHTAYSAGEGYWVFSNVLAGVSTNAQVYSTGDASEALVSEPPPAFLAICTVGDRMFAIDAEDRTRIWFTKPFDAGYAAEWSTTNTLFLGDQGVGISDVGGIPTVFCKRGIWQIYGEGPNALGVGSFAPARRLPHEVECLDGLSVCKIPSGVVFRSRKGITLLDTALQLQPIGHAVDASLQLSGTPTGYCKVAFDELSDELHVLDFDAQHWVFNVGEGKWSRYSQGTSDQNWRDATVVNGRVYYLHRGSSHDSIERLYALDEVSSFAYNDTQTGWNLETPWVRFDGVTGNMRVWEVIVQLRGGDVENGGELGGTVTAIYETRDGTTEQFQWTAAQMQALIGAGDTVNLRMRVTHQRTRQFRILLAEAAPSYSYSGTSPIALRVLYGVTPGGERNRTVGQNAGSLGGS
jgi:hypothetical protein